MKKIDTVCPLPMTTPQNHDDLILPLGAIGILLLLVILVYGQFANAKEKPGTVVLPGGVTYLGK